MWHCVVVIFHGMSTCVSSPSSSLSSSSSRQFYVISLGRPRKCMYMTADINSRFCGSVCVQDGHDVPPPIKFDTETSELPETKVKDLPF